MRVARHASLSARSPVRQANGHHRRQKRQQARHLTVTGLLS
jgi:hypothetical protein